MGHYATVAVLPQTVPADEQSIRRALRAAGTVHPDCEYTGEYDHAYPLDAALANLPAVVVHDSRYAAVEAARDSRGRSGVGAAA